jgi:imidazoleglycerol phosphate dehydratase HisB
MTEHTPMKMGITLGQALGKALGDRGIIRFGSFLAPREALIQVALTALDAHTSAMGCKSPLLGLGLTHPTCESFLSQW